MEEKYDCAEMAGDNCAPELKASTKPFPRNQGYAADIRLDPNVQQMLGDALAKQSSGAAERLRRYSLRNRVQDRLDEAEKSSAKLGKLTELQMLLAKNPEVARILELLEEVF